ncbi:protein tyrosine phosphatase family protein [uncultured Microbulbifer sp.]|uniref:protein tyrosine phosphatase family protein n=1 Tax=uncultured Microbulbifer sp. TaxID=348147 RepID=UPI0025E64F7A|nr:protein tyrosine phosphatase family protein [uncultured Microbulbifer sp.]
MKLLKVLVAHCFFTLGLAAPLLAAAEEASQVPFGDKVGTEITNYNRLRPLIATGGSIDLARIDTIAKLGFKTIVDLRTPEEGVAQEKAAVEAAGMRYLNLPVDKGVPSEQVIAGLSAVLADNSAAPVLVHCGSGNRVGTAWAIYRAQSGVPLEIAIEEGRAAGMRDSRERQVRALLAEPVAE